MKKILSVAMAAVMAGGITAAFAPQKVHADNPCIQTIYSTDPAPMVYDDTLYLYTGRDKDNSSNYFMPDWHCYSTTDMQNWTDHGCILSWDSFTWGKEDSAWAAQCIERNGKFYYYVTLNHKNGGGRAIGVAVADSPTGPFKDALGKPLVGPNWDYIDPTVFIDDDGQAWLMFGNPTCYYVKLNEDMTSYSGSIGKFDMNKNTFGPSDKRASSYGEGPWFYKRNGLYYLVYAAFYGSDGGESIGYSTAPSPTGPWTYGGQVMKTHNCFTNHPGVVDYKGKSYFFYHDASLKGGGTFDRSVCVDEFEYGRDGSIPTITPTKTGPQQIEALNPFVRNEAETICYSEGIKTETCSSGGLDIGNIENGDYIKVSGVDFGDGADNFTASVASNTDGGTIELHIDSKTGPVIGKVDVGNTGGWQTWDEVTTDVVADGEHDLYFVFKGGDGYLLNVDWWKFSGPGGSDPDPVDPDPESYIIHNTFERGTESWSGHGGASVSTTSSGAYQGKKCVKVTDRSAAWNGVEKKLGSSLEAGSTYSFSVNAKYDDGDPTSVFHFTLQYTGTDGEVYYDKLDTVTAAKGQWVQLSNQNYTLPAGATDMIIFVETGDGKADFYIDDFVAAQKGTAIDGAVGGTFALGDIDADGRINAFDLALARMGIISGFDSDMAALAADVDRSGKFEINDVVLIQQFILGNIKEFPDNTPEPEPSNFIYDSALQFKAAPDKYLEPCSQAGKIIKESYTGINGNKSLNVYLPYGYDSSKKYNIFYLMHGGGENENTIFSNDVKMHNILDHMIMNGELEPLIVVTPTFNGCPAPDNNMGAGTVWDEMRQSIIPFVEKKYSTYANSTSEADLKASRYHRAYGGFSMGGGSTWNMFINNLDICAYYMPLSGHCWGGLTGLQNAIDKSGFQKNEYFIFAATGSKDLAYNNMLGLINPLKQDTKRFTTTSDFSKGNFYFLVADGRDHWWDHVRHYIYDALPYFFHEGQ